MASVVPPTKEIDPGPYVSGGMWLSFWEHVEIRETPLAAPEIGRALRTLHDALADYRGPLPSRSAILGEIDWLLAALAGDEGLSELAAERDRLAEIIVELEQLRHRQPLHGDASLSALLTTSRGPRWNDFEDVCAGAVEWDVAGLVSDARAAQRRCVRRRGARGVRRRMRPVGARTSRSGLRAVRRPLAPLPPSP